MIVERNLLRQKKLKIHGELITISKLLSVIGQISGQFVKPKNIAVKGPSKDASVIISLFTSFNEKEEP